jgi:hypothetical protein
MARPVLEGLEGRQLLSSGPSGSAVDVAPPKGVFSHNYRQFKYRTPNGGTAVITMMGVGNLKGTNVGPTGLNIEYAATNTFSKIVGKVYGGDGQAPLMSIVNRHLVEARQELLGENPRTTKPSATDVYSALNNLSGVGGNPLQAVILNQWNLVSGGNINLTSGVNSLVLNSIGADTQVHLRDIPAEILPTALVANATAVSQSSGSSSSSSSSTASSSPFSRSSSSSSSSSGAVTPTLPVGVPTPITNANGTTWTYKLENAQDLTLVGVSGSFSAQPNEIESLPPGQPRQTPPPAPPGIILKVNAIYGASPEPINLLTDPVVWGYDATLGELLQFNLNLATGTGVPVPNGPTISVPKNLPALGLNLGWDGSQLDLLVGFGTTVYAYNATTGAKVGSFTTSNLTELGDITSIGSTDNVTVLGDESKFVMIDLPASLESNTHMAQPEPPGAPAPFTPQAPLNTTPSTFMLLGGLTGLPGSTTVYGAIQATFNPLQSTAAQLGFQPANTVEVAHDNKKGSRVKYKFTGGTPLAYTSAGAYTNVTNGEPGSAVGSVDSNLAVVFNPPASVDQNVVELVNPTTGSQVAEISLMASNGMTPYPDSIVALSSSFRPDLNGTSPMESSAGPALIDIQGDVQSFRGRKATGMVFNDTGNLNLVKFSTITDSTIVGQPIGHIDVTQHFVNVTMLTPLRNVSTRGGVQVIGNLQQIGPLSFTGD